MSENLIDLEVVTPDKHVIQEPVKSARAQGTLGEFGILPGHTPFLSSLDIGVLKYIDSSNQERFVFINSGFAEVLPNKITILTESAEKSDDIDIERAKKAFDRNQQRIDKAKEKAGQKEEIDEARAQSSLKRAITRLKIKEAS